jgi:hypothetical protein
MSKTWKHANSRNRSETGPSPQATIDRLRNTEAQQEIREALTAPQEAQHAT